MRSRSAAVMLAPIASSEGSCWIALESITAEGCPAGVDVAAAAAIIAARIAGLVNGADITTSTLEQVGFQSPAAPGSVRSLGR